MKDLTNGSIAKNILQMAVPIAAGMFFQTLYFLIDFIPAVLSSASRLVSFVVPALWLASQPNFQLIQLWYASIASVTLQACISLWLVRGEFRQRLDVRAGSVAA
jgi:Na+-driven multidrug efflux pump